MTITITDPALLAQLAAADGVVELADPTGRVVAHAMTDWPGKPPVNYVPQISEQKLERRRRENRTGRPLADILRDLEARK